MPSRLVKVVRDFMTPWHARPGVVAVSGGADSVALLRSLLEAGCTRLAVAHVNHQLRDKESDDDEAFVRALAESLHLPVSCQRIAVEAMPGNLEGNARQARYEVFEQVAKEHGAEWIATGHSADDQAETVLHRLLRGTGLRGLRGIAPERAGGVARIIRPLLTMTRPEIIEYLASANQPFRTDSTNADPRFLRNRIRGGILPLLKSLNPGIASVLGQLAEQAGEAQAFMEVHAHQLLKSAEKPRAGRVVILDRKILENAPPILVCEMMRLVWRREGWPMGEMGFDQWSHAQRVLPRDFPGGVSLRVREKVVQLSPSSGFPVPGSDADS